MLVLPDDMVGRRIGFTCSAFDLLHAGHILMLAEAKSICDYLIVGLQNDPTIDRASKNKPVQSIVERYVQLQAVKFVDEIVVYNTEKDLEDLLMFLPFNLRIIGEEYEGKEFTGKNICEERGIKIWYNSRKHRFSSSELRKRTYQSELDKIDLNKISIVPFEDLHSNTKSSTYDSFFDSKNIKIDPKINPPLNVLDPYTNYRNGYISCENNEDPVYSYKLDVKAI